VNRQFTKISWDARESSSLAMMLRRALRVATTDPGGPVYLAMAGYALEAKGVTATILPAERFLFRARARPDPAMVERTARLLIEAGNPVIIAGDEVWKSGGQAELVDLAESLGIGVTNLQYVQTFENFPSRHPLQLAGQLPEDVDVLFFVGARDAGGRVVPRAPELPGTARIARLGMETGSMGRNYPSDVTLLGDVKTGLRDVRAAVDGLLTRGRRTSIAGARRKPLDAANASRHARAAQAIAANLGRTPIHPDELGKVLAETIDRNAIVVSENLSGSFDSFRFGFRDDEQTYLGAGGASLGWGLGAAAGRARARIAR
jgi:benzoylformate decarboxylase